jgi:hypothetical protein
MTNDESRMTMGTVDRESGQAAFLRGFAPSRESVQFQRGGRLESCPGGARVVMGRDIPGRGPWAGVGLPLRGG